jgi:hypothetical protein
MSGLKLLVILAVGVAVVGVVVMSPGLREHVGGFIKAAEKDVGPGRPSDTIGSEVKVYAPRGDRFYHTRDCPRLRALNAVPMRLSEARALHYEPCPECRPPQ